jgi:3,4-dihydroxy 2-butanone 4-phosphate synthase
MTQSALHSFGATPHARVQAAISQMRKGQPIILVDDENRENEGDLVIAADNVNAENVNFLIRHGSGIICLTLTEEKTKELNLPLMVTEESLAGPFAARFTVSIEARHGVTTGVSANDRATTIKTAISDKAKPEDLCRPGHIFPLRAKKGGLKERQGHTEGSIALAQLAGLRPAAAICELMNPDGSMARLNDAIQFAKTHHLIVLSIQDLMGEF